MKKILLLSLLSTVVSYGAEEPTVHAISTVGLKTETQRTAALGGSRNTFVLPGDDVLPHLVNGDGWKSQIFLTNLSRIRMSYTLDFWRSDGSYWPVSIIGRGTGDQFTGSLPPGGSLLLETSGTGRLEAGWAELTYDSNIGYIGGMGVFRQSVFGRPDLEAVVPFTNLFQRQIVVPYDNANGFATGVACVNGSRRNSATITASFRDESGNTYATETIRLGASGHVAFMLPSEVSSTHGRRGTILFRSNTDFFSVLGLRFNPGGSFTSFNGLLTIDMFEGR